MNTAPTAVDDPPPPAAPVREPQGLGTISGVFAPVMLAILGAILFLRLGWMVGNAGLAGAIAVVLLAHLITGSSALAISSIATNIRAGQGGAFQTIAQSLGLEAAGTLALPFYLAQCGTAALMILGFAEGWERLFPSHEEQLVALVAFLAVFFVCWLMPRLIGALRPLVLAIVLAALVVVFLGSLPRGGVRPAQFVPVPWGTFEAAGFWATFAIFFPAVTGILAGFRSTNNLATPRKSIPTGLLWGVGVTFLLYLAATVWLARVAPPEELLVRKLVMVDRALFAPAALAGLLAATFMGGVSAVLSAPRLAQQLGTNNILPLSRFFAAETRSGYPLNALLATGILVLTLVSVGLFSATADKRGLDIIAPVVTLLFLLTYGILNLVVFIEQTLDTVSFRPTFRISRFVPLMSLALCGLALVMINPLFAILAPTVLVAVYAYMMGRKLPTTEKGDVRSGLFLSLAKWAAEMVEAIPKATERTWQPNILAPVKTSDELMGGYRFLRALTSGQGSVHVLGIHNGEGREAVARLPLLQRDFQAEGIFARTTLLEQAEFTDGAEAAMEVLGGTFFQPNILFLRLFPDQDPEELKRLMATAVERNMGLAILDQHPLQEFGREQQINVWVREQGPEWQMAMRLGSLDLSMLLAYQLARNWRGRIRLCMAVREAATVPRAEEYLADLIDRARLRRWAEHTVLALPFDEALQKVPHADMTFLGLPAEPDVDAIQALKEKVDGSCVLVRGSGNESVLA